MSGTTLYTADSNRPISKMDEKKGGRELESSLSKKESNHLNQFQFTGSATQNKAGYKL